MRRWQFADGPRLHACERNGHEQMQPRRRWLRLLLRIGASGPRRQRSSPVLRRVNGGKEQEGAGTVKKSPLSVACGNRARWRRVMNPVRVKCAQRNDPGGLA